MTEYKETNQGTYTVNNTGEKGGYDTLTSIAERFGVTVDSLKSANNLESNTIKKGDSLQVPNAPKSESASKITPDQQPEKGLLEKANDYIKGKLGQFESWVEGLKGTTERGAGEGDSQPTIGGTPWSSNPNGKVNESNDPRNQLAPGGTRVDNDGDLQEALGAAAGGMKTGGKTGGAGKIASGNKKPYDPASKARDGAKSLDKTIKEAGFDYAESVPETKAEPSDTLFREWYRADGSSKGTGYSTLGSLDHRFEFLS